MLLFVLAGKQKKKDNGSKEMMILPNCFLILLENEKFFELKGRGYRDGIKRKETNRDGV